MKTNAIVWLCIVIVLLTAGSASAWLDMYACRQSINLTGATDGAQTDYQLNLSIPYAASMQGDFDDVRFTQADGVTLIDAWLETKVDDTSADVWVEFPTTPANSAHQTYYMYYGKAAAASDWNGSATFLKFDDFETGDLTTGPLSWTPRSSSESSGVAHVDASGGDHQQMYTSSTLHENVAWGFDWRKNEPGNTVFIFGFISNVFDWGTFDGLYNLEISGANVYLSNDRSVHRITTTWANDQLDHTFEVTKDGSNNFELFLDGASKGTTTDVDFSASSYMTFWEHGSIGIDIDDFRVRKYVDNPATYAFGSEEQIPSPSDPSITAYNNITGPRAHVPLDYGTAVLFNATAGAGITWAWALDGVDQSNSYDNYTHTFANGFGYYSVTVTATNMYNTTSTYTWGVWENIETTAETIPTFTDTSYQMLLDSIDYPPDMEEFGKAMAHPFVQMVGVIFYLFIFGIPLLMMYIRQDNMTMPTTLLLLFGSIIIFMLPPQWQIIAGALMTLGFVGILFKLYKERER